MRGGGAERVAANLANNWAASGHQVAVVTLAPRNLDFYALRPTVGRISLELSTDSGGRLLTGLRQNLRRVSKLRRVLREFRPSIALGMMTNANVLLALATSRLPGVLRIGSEHIHPPQAPLTNIWEYLRATSYGCLDAVTALTIETSVWLAENTRARKVPVIPNPVLWPLPVHAPIRDCALLLPAGRRTVLAVGRLEHQKGFDLLFDAFSPLATKFPLWDLVILGEGRLRKDLESQIARLGLDGRVKLIGQVGNVGDWYGASDVYVLSSRFEGFPNTLLEAMAHGLPAVAFDCDTGPRDIVRHEIDGLLVEPGNVQDLSAAIRRLMEDEDLRARLSVRAADAKQRFSIERIAGIWEELFEDLLTASAQRLSA